MEWSQEEIDRLRAAVASGVKTVIYDGPPRREVTYQNLDDMRDLLASMTATSVAGVPYRLAATRKGL